MTIWEEPLRLIRPALPEGHRIIVTSDIHGNIPYFRGLLEKLKYTEEDILIIDGDFLERGPDSLGLLREIMALSRKGTVYTLCGNCDSWADILTNQDRFEDSFYWVGRYVRMRRSGLLWNMLQEQNIAVTEDLDILDTIIRIQDAYREEWEFLRNLPVALDTPGYLYVHGGVRPDIPLEQQNNGSCMKFDNFRARGYHFPKWVVVGHWPVMLYRSRCIDASPLVDLRQKVIVGIIALVGVILPLHAGVLIRGNGLPGTIADFCGCNRLAGVGAFPGVIRFRRGEIGSEHCGCASDHHGRGDCERCHFSDSHRYPSFEILPFPWSCQSRLRRTAVDRMLSCLFLICTADGSGCGAALPTL